MKLAVLFLVTCSLCAGVDLPKNPCPEIFQYKNEDGVVFGKIVLPNEYKGPKANIQKTLKLFVRGSFKAGKFLSDKSIKITLVTPKKGVSKSENLVYRLDFPAQTVIPKITEITLNEKKYCVGPPEDVFVVKYGSNKVIS